jgi:hypothetical protein
MSQQQQPGKKPTHRIFHVRGEGENAYRTPIRAGWIHKDGEGMTINLDFIPTDGCKHLVIRANRDSDQSERGAR